MTREPRTKRATEARRLPDGMRYTKHYRFTLPEDLADEFDRLNKAERDNLVEEGLRQRLERRAT